MQVDARGGRSVGVTPEQLVDRRGFLARAAVLGAGAAIGTTPGLASGRAVGRRGSVGRGRTVPLPSPERIRRDFTRMVEFGPRLTASPDHERYIGWLEERFDRAGLRLLDCDGYTTERWLAQDFGLRLLDGPHAGPARIAAYYPRSQETPATGVTGPLVYGGTAPSLSITGADLTALQDAIARYPSELASWARGLGGTLQGGAQGSILLVDLPMTVPLTAGAFLPIATYLSWPGHSIADWAGI